MSDDTVPKRGGTLLGRGSEPFCEVALYRHGDALRLHHSCTGWFELRAGGTEIVWTAQTPDVPIEAVRADVFGRVLAVAMHLQGVLSLHASAVALERGAVALVAPKEHGKSTLAMALTDAGGRFVTDDLLAVRFESSPVVTPGVQTARLHGDSAALVRESRVTRRMGIDGKYVLRHARTTRLFRGRAPLDAIYLLSPVASLPRGRAVMRTRVPTGIATMLLVAHAKVGALLGGAEAPIVLRRAADVARTVPVYRLDVVRDLGRLGEVCAELRTWHTVSGGAVPPRAVGTM